MYPVRSKKEMHTTASAHKPSQKAYTQLKGGIGKRDWGYCRGFHKVDYYCKDATYSSICKVFDSLSTFFTWKYLVNILSKTWFLAISPVIPTRRGGMGKVHHISWSKTSGITLVAPL